MKKILIAATALLSFVPVVQAQECTVRFIAPVIHQAIAELLDRVDECRLQGDKFPLVIIETPGGDASAMMLAVNELTDKVDTHIGYSASSAGVTLALIGKKRTMARNGFIYIHDTVWENEGGQSSTADLLSPEAKERNAKDKKNLLPIATDDYIAFVVARTKLQPSAVEVMMKETKVIRYDEALALGFTTQETPTKK